MARGRLGHTSPILRTRSEGPFSALSVLVAVLWELHRD